MGSRQGVSEGPVQVAGSLQAEYRHRRESALDLPRRNYSNSVQRSEAGSTCANHYQARRLRLTRLSFLHCLLAWCRIASDPTAKCSAATQWVEFPGGEIEAAPFASKTGGPSNKGRLAAAYDRPGIATAAGERRFQLNDRVFVELPKGSPGAPGDLLLSYRLGPELSEVGQLVVPTGILEIQSHQSGQPALARVVRQFGEMRLDRSLILLESIPASVRQRLSQSRRDRPRRSCTSRVTLCFLRFRATSF